MGKSTLTTLVSNNFSGYNSIRYRGYYYDTETGFYFLNSRYYSPEWRRFIQPAGASSLNPDSVNGLNLYCYANNNPVGVAYSGFSSGSAGAMVGGMVNSLVLGSGLSGESGVNNSKIPRNLPPVPGWVETLSTAIDHSFSIINPIRTAGYIAKYPNLWDVMRLDGVTELPGVLSKVATGVGWGLGIIGGAIAGYEKYNSGASVISSFSGGVINAGISIGGMYAATGLASLAMGALVGLGAPGGAVVVAGAIVAVAVGVGINYVFTQADFFGNTLEGYLNDFVDWLIFWD